VESDNQTELLNQAEVLPETTTKRKASSDPNVHQPKSTKKSSKKNKNKKTTTKKTKKNGKSGHGLRNGWNFYEIS